MSMTEHEKPKLYHTKDLSIFEMHELNRDLSDHSALEESMRKHGFMPSSPIQCVRNGRGKLKVIRGHHRLHYAKAIGLPVWYVVDPTVTDIFELEGDSGSRWNIKDFLHARAKAKGQPGNEDCARVIAFQKEHQINQGVAICLMAGDGAGSTNAYEKVKRGTFRVSRNLTHAMLVAELVDFCRAAGAACAGTSGFVKALSSVARVPQFEPDLFKRRVKKMPSLLARQATSKSYMEIIEEVYNYGAKDKRIPLAFLATEEGRKRKETFGGKKALGRKLGAEARKAAGKRPVTRATSVQQGL